MDIASLIAERLEEIGIGQRDLAIAAGVTESYISQLLANKKTPPASDRTDIYEKIAKILKLSGRELGRLADTQRWEELRRKVLDPAQPLFKEFRDLVLRKCVAKKKKQMTRIFEREPFGEFERFVTQKLLDVSKRAAREELGDENWIHRVAKRGKRSYEETRVSILEFLDTDVFHVSTENCITFVDPLIVSWDIDLETFSMEIVLNRKWSRNHRRRLEFRETETGPAFKIEPGLNQFLNDSKLSDGVTDEEVAFLRTLRFKSKHPLPLYYYRELQNLRDPLNFRHAPTPKVATYKPQGRRPK